jgi:hypothetical protein
MNYALQVCSYALWFPLMFLTINAVLGAGIRRYPLVFTYLIVTLLIGVSQAPAALAYHRTFRQGEWLQLVQAVGEGVSYALMLAVVVSMIYEATTQSGARRLLRAALIAGALLVMLISFLVHYDSKALLGVWITPWTRDLKFFAAVLDLALWALLLTKRKPDSRLLVLTGGMGIMFAGGAIGESVRHLAIRSRSNPLFLTGNAIAALADLAFLFIWWRGFRHEAVASKQAQSASSG